MKITAIQTVQNVRMHRGLDGKTVRVNVGRRLASVTTSHQLPEHIRLNGVWMVPAPKLEALGLEDEFLEGGGDRRASLPEPIWRKVAEHLRMENACLKHSIDQERERRELERNPHREALEDFRHAWLNLFQEILRELTPQRWRKEVEA